MNKNQKNAKRDHTSEIKGRGKNLPEVGMFTHRGISGVKAVNEVLSRSSISLNEVLVPKDRYTDPGSIRVWRETEHNIPLVGVFFFPLFNSGLR